MIHIHQQLAAVARKKAASDPIGDALRAVDAAYWILNESSAGSSPVSRADASGNGFTMTDNNTTASITDGTYGEVADFERGNLEYLSNANEPVGGDTTFSFDGWLYLESSVGGGTQGVITSGIGADAQRRYFLDITSDKLRWLVFNGSGGVVLNKSTTASLSTATWYYFYCSHNHTANTGTVGFAGTYESAATSGAAGAASTNPFGLGIQQNTSYNLDGRLRHVGAYTRELTTEERSWRASGGVLYA